MTERLIEVYKHIESVRKRTNYLSYPGSALVELLAVIHSYIERRKAVLILGDGKYKGVFKQYLREYHSFEDDIWKFSFKDELFMDDPISALATAVGISVKEPQKSVFLVVNEDVVCKRELWGWLTHCMEYNLGNLVMFIEYMALYIKSDMLPIADKWRAFGWDFQEVNARNVSMLFSAIERSLADKNVPSAVLLYTLTNHRFRDVVNLQ